MRTVADVNAILSLSCTQSPPDKYSNGSYFDVFVFAKEQIKEKMFKFINGCIFGDHFRT